MLIVLPAWAVEAIQDARAVVDPTQAGIAMVGLAARWGVTRMLKPRDPEYLARVRASVRNGDFEEAAAIQLQQGNVDEARRLYLRGGFTEEARDCAVRLGLVPRRKAKRTRQRKPMRRDWQPETEVEHKSRAAAWGAAEPEPTPVAPRPAPPAAAPDLHSRLEPAPTPAPVATGLEIPLVVAEPKPKPKPVPVAGDATVNVAPPVSFGGGSSDTIAMPPPATETPRAVDVRSATIAVAAPARPGEPATSDRYTLVAKLGEGGMGVVYRARDEVLARDVALKFLPESMAQDDRACEMFKSEARAAASVVHPNIITVHDFGVMGGRPFLCMEFVDGLSARDLLEQSAGGGLQLPLVMEIARGLCGALATAHAKDLVHRDVKPANIMMARAGTVKLTDFGIAKLLEPTRAATKVVGTPSYMSAEQFTGKGIDPRTDIFAVGVTLYEMLSGELPYEGVDRNTPPRELRELRVDTPQPLADTVMRCLKFKKEDRPNSLDGILGLVKVPGSSPASTSVAAPEPAPEPAAKPARTLFGVGMGRPGGR